MKKKFTLEKLPKGKKELYYTCINQFFFNKLPLINVISKLPIMKSHFGKSVSTLGIEKTQEICIGLFEKGILELVINKDTFQVFLKHKNNLLLMYKGEIGKQNGKNK